MMPDLGEYAGAVLWSYGASAALMVGIVVLSVWQAGRVRRALAEIEARQGKTDG